MFCWTGPTKTTKNLFLSIPLWEKCGKSKFHIDWRNGFLRTQHKKNAFDMKKIFFSGRKNDGPIRQQRFTGVNCSRNFENGKIYVIAASSLTRKHHCCNQVCGQRKQYHVCRIGPSSPFMNRRNAYIDTKSYFFTKWHFYLHMFTYIGFLFPNVPILIIT
jgi:hypothetical protein